MKRPNRKRQVTTITLGPEVVKEAREAGLNISRVAETAIKQALERLKGTDCPAPSERPTTQDCDKNEWCGRRDLNPRSRLGEPESFGSI